MTDKRWTATIDYRVTHDTRRVDIYEFDEFEELGEHIEAGPNFHAIDKIVVVGNFTDLRTTLVEEAINNDEVVSEPHVISPWDVRYD